MLSDEYPYDRVSGIFRFFLHHFVLAKLATTSIRVNMIWLSCTHLHGIRWRNVCDVLINISSSDIPRSVLLFERHCFFCQRIGFYPVFLAVPVLLWGFLFDQNILPFRNISRRNGSHIPTKQSTWQGRNQDLETGCLKLAIVTFLGIPIFQGRSQYIQITTINMGLLIDIRRNIFLECHGNYIEMDKLQLQT